MPDSTKSKTENRIDDVLDTIEYTKRSWAAVDLDAIAHNAGVIRTLLAPSCRIMAVVKADAYGHGDKYVAEELARAGTRVEWFGVSCFEEALALRAQGIERDILVFGPTAPERAWMLERYNITQTVFGAEYAARLGQAAQEQGVTVPIHIKVDTGMARLGFAAESSAADIADICRRQEFRAGGIYTHFSCADEADADAVAYTRAQYADFCAVLAELAEQGITFSLRHCCNSAATFNFPDMHMDMVRPGVALYGLNPGSDRPEAQQLHPAMALYSTVSMVKDVPAGTAVSYGRVYRAAQPLRVATVAIGYADGYARALSGKARMLVRGQFAPVIGRVCMDQLMLDVTGIAGVQAGDMVTLVGQDGAQALTFDEMAALSGTIHYEKICLIGKRVPRVYRKDGKEIGVEDYFRRKED